MKLEEERPKPRSRPKERVAGTLGRVKHVVVPSRDGRNQLGPAPAEFWDFSHGHAFKCVSGPSPLLWPEGSRPLKPAAHVVPYTYNESSLPQLWNTEIIGPKDRNHERVPNSCSSSNVVQLRRQARQA